LTLPGPRSPIRTPTSRWRRSSGAGAGPAPLCRSFASRRELLQALYVDEIDAVRQAADTITGDSPGAIIPPDRAFALMITARSCLSWASLPGSMVPGGPPTAEQEQAFAQRVHDLATQRMSAQRDLLGQYRDHTAAHPNMP
jgi:hypothetical protein